MKIIRIISIILILCAGFAVLASCGDNSGSGDATTTTQAQNNNGSGDPGEENAEEPQEQRILSEAPVEDHGGRAYRILGRLAVTANGHWDAKDLYAEEENGDVINDAVYKRNKKIEEKYNISITRVENLDPPALARTAVQAGSDDYDIIYAHLSSTISFASGGFGVNLKEVPHLDLDKPWYDQNANRQLSIGGKLFTTFSDFTILDKDSTWAYLFNKKLIADLGLEDPYLLVREGKWTVDKLYDMAKGASMDLDGDGVMGNWDQYGYMGESFNMYAGLIAADVIIFPKDADDLPMYNGVPERAFAAFEKLLQVLGSDQISLRAEDVSRKGYSGGGDIWTDVMDTGFMDGRVLFNNAGMNRITLFRSMEVDFGILPSPKLDEAQENYYNTVTQGSASSFVIPITLVGEDLARIGAITDALAAESMYTLIPAYYDTQLKTKLARDDDSSEMLDIIFANRRFDLGLIHGFGGVSSIFGTAMTGNNLNIASSLERSEARVRNDIEKLIRTYENIN
jgi:ABC-type glycerol-3-phosphate transport system substrate-binding protein